MPASGGEELTRSHLCALGCTEPEAAHVLALLKEEDRLAAYLRWAERQQIHCLTRGNSQYPPRLIRACLAAGGQVIVVLAAPCPPPADPHILLCWEDSFDLPFSPARALSRNRIIHALGEKTLVAQAAPGSGGTWRGTEENLRRGWSPVFLFDDCSPGALALMERGATGIGMSQLADFSALLPAQTTLF